MGEIGMRIIDMNNIIKNIWVLFVFLLSIGFFIVQSYLFNINWIVLLNFIFLFIIISKNNFLLKNIKKILFLFINIVILFFLLFLVVYSNSCYPDSDYVLRFGNFCLSFIKIIDFSNFISIILTFFILLCFFILYFDFLSKDSKFIVNKYLLFFMLGIFFYFYNLPRY